MWLPFIDEIGLGRMEHQVRIESERTTIILKDRFTFSDYREFRHIADDVIGDKNKDYLFDLSALEFIDSAALGMLLLAQDKAKKLNKKITLKSPRGQVKRVFEVANFSMKFHIL